MIEKTLTTGAAAQLCGVTPDTVLKWIKRGQLEAQRTPGGHYRIRRGVLDRFLHESSSEIAPSDSSSRKKCSFCWEYYADKGQPKSGCRNCVVFKAKAERCYLLANLGAQAGHEGINCRDSCEACPYFHLINKARFSLLIVTENCDLKDALANNLNQLYTIRFADSGYEAALLIQAGQPDYIVIDHRMESAKCEELIRHMLQDTRLQGSQIVLAVDRDTYRHRLREGVCASVHLPVTAQELETCFHNLRIRLLGMQN